MMLFIIEGMIVIIAAFLVGMIVMKFIETFNGE